MRKSINRVSKENYGMYLLTEHCMPVLLGIKPSNIITAHKRKMVCQEEFINCVYKEVMGFNCRLSTLYENEEVYIFFIYNYDLLESILTHEESCRFLRQVGYWQYEKTVEKQIELIKSRYYKYKEERGSFPHEIGIFLGYPLEDVKGFIANNGRYYLLNGYWKVYGDVKQAKETFRLYQMAREVGRVIYSTITTTLY